MLKAHGLRAATVLLSLSLSLSLASSSYGREDEPAQGLIDAVFRAFGDGLI